MEEHRARITRNTIFITSALVGQKIFSFIFFALVARFMDVEDTGKYFLAVSFTLMFSVLADLGFSPFIVRESAKLREGVGKQLGGILGAKVALSILTFFIINGTAYFLPYPDITKQLILIGSLNILFESWHLTLYSFLRGWQRLEFESLGIIGGQAITLALGVASLFFFRSLHLLMVALLIGNAANFFWAFYFAVLRFRIPLGITLRWSAIRSALVIVIPFALAAVFTRVTGFIDTFLLSLLGTETMVGLYSVPFKVTFALQFIPLAFSASLLPALSNFAKTSHDLLAKTYTTATLYLFFIALPVVFGIAGLADVLIPTVFGEKYLASVATQRVLVMSLIFLFLNFPIGAFLVATNRQTLNTTFLGIMMATNIVLNVFLIPRFGIMGPAFAALLSNFLLFALGFSFVARSIALPFDRLLHGVVKAVIAVSAMTAVLMAAKSSLHLVALILLGAVVYGGALLLLRAVTKDDVRKIFGAFRKEAV